MTREKIISLARECGFAEASNADKYMKHFRATGSNLEAFYHAARAEAFEAAAKLCDELDIEENSYGYRNGAVFCAARIRKMAKEKQNG